MLVCSQCQPPRWVSLEPPAIQARMPYRLAAAAGRSGLTRVRHTIPARQHEAIHLAFAGLGTCDPSAPGQIASADDRYERLIVGRTGQSILPLASGAQERMPPYSRDGAQRPESVHVAIRQHDDRSAGRDRVRLGEPSFSMQSPGAFGCDQDDVPRHRDGAAADGDSCVEDGAALSRCHGSSWSIQRSNGAKQVVASNVRRWHPCAAPDVWRAVRYPSRRRWNGVWSRC